MLRNLQNRVCAAASGPAGPGSSQLHNAAVLRRQVLRRHCLPARGHRAGERWGCLRHQTRSAAAMSALAASALALLLSQPLA
jgi:hypothetical protein